MKLVYLKIFVLHCIFLSLLYYLSYLFIYTANSIIYMIEKNLFE